jgi:uncharacterized protein
VTLTDATISVNAGGIGAVKRGKTPGAVLTVNRPRFRFDQSAPRARITLMNRIEAIDSLKRRADAIKAMGATSLYLFGSVAQDQAGRGSDLDLFIDYDPNGRFNAFDLVGIKQFLETELGVDIDITTRDGLHPMLRDAIEQSAIRVF